MQRLSNDLQRPRGRAPVGWHHRLARRPAVTCRASTSPFQVRLLHPARPDGAEGRPLLVFLPGTDGTGQAILPQLPGLLKAGWDVRTLYIPPENRSGWEQLQSQVLYLIESALEARPPELRRATLVAESFGGCLALRMALAAPRLFGAMALLNPATSFSGSLGGLSSFVTATNLLGLFPRDLYTTSQTVMMPLLVDSERVGSVGADALRRMMLMEPPTDVDGMSPGDASSDASSDDPDDAWGGGGAAAWGAARNRGGSAAGAAAPFGAPPGPAFGGGGTPVFAPAAAANFRANLLRQGNLPDSQLARVAVPTVVVVSARDRMLPSLAEGARLQRLIPGAKRVILPNSGHAALLEFGVDLASLLADAGMAPPRLAGAPESGARGRAQEGGRDHGSGGGGGANGAAAGAAAAKGGGAEANGNGGGAAAAGAGGGAANEAASPGPSRGPSPGSSPWQSTDGSRPNSPAPAESDLSWDEWSQLLAPWRDLVSPVVVGSELLPDPSDGRPILFVGNHQRIGLYDMPLFMYELYLRGFKPKGLAHPGHWAGPLGPFFEKFGAVKAGPMTAYKLLKRGEQVLLFPGGAREVNKPRGAEYTLSWPEARPDFVRLAGKTGAVIVPFSAVGADDAYDVMMDVDELLENPLLGGLATAAIARWAPGLNPRDALLPITALPGTGSVRIPALIPLPNLQRLYFRIGRPVDTAELGLGAKDAGAWQALYDSIRDEVYDGMRELLELRMGDADRSVDSRVGRAVGAWLSSIAGGGGGNGNGGNGNGGGGGGGEPGGRP
ncbi:alpha beta-hydrolase [Raphidocelis subcapitata]|uniref:Alpha beta-hydrolase n=1 Tax=Raphidocelis subcapitata TaxID=307507 RepID=A0A2V0NLF5_9CHLO|nr:alpha beta-hydrolase [Raphidocelis subcapitata]|eukprot:GBF88231.1 alpha beta-hydrolase [Raphidocelis subcapitata]